MKCANCIESKMSNEPFLNDRTRATAKKSIYYLLFRLSSQIEIKK